MRALPSCVKGIIYSFLCIFTLAQTGFGQGPAAASAYGKLPLSFEPNQGQTAGEVQFLSRGRGYTLFLSSSDSVLALHRGHRGSRTDRMEPGPSAEAPAALRMHLVGANASAQGIAEEALPGKSNYLIGNDRAKWRTDVPNYGRVRYRGVYPGIDLVYYGNQRLLEHDFEVAPGADPRRIRLAFEGIQRAAVEKSGDLVLQLADGEVRLQKPVIYQNTEQGRREVTGGFVLRKNQVTIQVGAYDRRRALVIDPVLSYSTYLGGTGEEAGSAVATDSSGNVYVVGITASTAANGFPIKTQVSATGCAAVTPAGCSGGADDVFIVKINPSGTGGTAGTALVYSTFLGGNGDDEGYAISVDGSNNAYVTGFTSSTDFPLSTSPAPYQSTIGSFQGNAFVSKINAAGNALLYSTYLGGHARDWGNAITQDSGGNIYVTGFAYSRDFPTLSTLSAPPVTLFASPNSGTSWTAAGGITSLQVTAFAMDAANSGTLYAGQAGSGVIKSTDFGATWTATVATQSFTNALIIDRTTSGATAVLYEGSRFGGVRKFSAVTGSTFINSGLGNFNVLSLAQDTITAGTLYAGTNGSGVWVNTTINGPTPTWSQKPTAGLGNRVINALAIDPAGVVYAGTNNGVYLLTPGGASWTSVAGGPAGLAVLALAIDSSSRVYAASFGGGLFKLNAGAWTTLNGSGGTALGTLNLRAVAVDPVSPSIIYAGGRVGMFRSADGGATWTAINSGLTVNSVQTIAIDPAATAHVYSGMVNLMSFVAKFNSGGSPTVLALFGGASGTTEAFSIAVDNPTSQNMFIGGYTSSASMPAPLVGQAYGGNFDGFVAEISTVGTPSIVWDRYLGGAFDDVVLSLALDQNGNVDVTGYTTSANFPVTAGAFQSTLNGPPNQNADAFLTELDPSGVTVLYSTFLGGSGWDEGTGVAVIPAASVASISRTSGGSGYTSTPTVTISGGGGSGATATATLTGGVVTAIAVTNPGSGYVLVPGVLISGGGGVGATATAILSATSPLISVAGDSNSTDLPTANPLQSSNAGGYDTFYARFDPSQSGAAGLLYSTYLGGNSDDFAFFLNNLALDSLGAAWITGESFSTNFPTTASNAVQPAGSSTVATSGDAFVYRIQTTGNASDVAIGMAVPSTTVYEGQAFSYSIFASNNGPNPAGAPSVTVTGTIPSNLTVTSVITPQGTCSTGQRFTCNLGTVGIGAGAAVTITVNVTANTVATPPTGPTMTATASVATADDDLVPANNATSLPMTVQVQADLMVTNATPAQQALGYSPTTLVDHTPTTDWFNITNNGPSNATGVIVTIPVPAGITFNGSGNGFPCTLSGSTVTCTVGNIAAGATSAVLFVWTPITPGTVTITATVSSSQVIDANLTNNSASWTTTVTPAVDLSITASLSSSLVPVGGSAAIVLTIRNNSTTDTATFPSLQVNLSPGMFYQSFASSSAAASCSVEGPVFCSLPDLAPNTSLTVTIFATAVLQGTYSANASVNSSGTDTNPANNSATSVVTFTGALNSFLTTLLTDYESSTVHGYSGFPTPTPVCCGLPATVGASPANVVIAPNGRLAFTANVNGSYISVLDLTIQAEIARIRDVRTFSLAMTSDGQKLVSVGQFNDELDVVDIATLAVTRISLDGKVGDAVGVNDIGPFSLALVGYQAYIANNFGPVIVVNFATPGSPIISTVAGTAALSPLHSGHQVAATPDGSTLAVFGRLKTGGAALIYLINTSTNTSQTVTTTFGGARTIAITRNPNAASGVVAFLGFANGAIRVLDLRIGSPTYGQVLTGSVSLGSPVTDMALTPDGNTLQAVNGVFQGSSGPPGTLYTLNAALIVTSPSTALVSSVSIPNSISVRGLAIGYVQTAPSSGAPQIFEVVPSAITNESPKTVTIFGDNFAPGARVRIGNLDPLPSTFISRQQITVSVPAAAAVQLGSIVVTLPNSAAGPLAANVSGSGSQNNRMLRISPPPSFAPSHPVAVSAFSVPNLSLLFRDSALLPGGPFSPALGISPDGLYAYSGLAEVDITNLDTEQSLAPVLGPTSGFGTQTFYDCARGSDNYAIAPDPTTGKKVLYLVSCDAATESSDTLYMVDVDPSTATRNTLLPRTIQVPNTDFAGSQALAVTPDGRFVYSADVNFTNGGTRLVIFDVLNSTSTIIPDITTLGADPTQQHIHVTPDGHSLLLSGPGGTTIKVYDIQGANATAPVLVTTITGSGAPTTNPPLLYWFQVVGTRLFAYASDQRYIQVFNFDRATPNFAALGSYTIPSPAGRFAGAAMAVTPEGTLIYAVLENEDAVAVLDANLVAASSPNSLITKMRTAINPANVAVSPRGNATADLLADILTASAGAGTVAAPVNKPFDLILSVDNAGPSLATGVTMTLSIPAGVQVNSATVTSALFAGPLPCIVTTTQVVCPVNTLEPSSFLGEDVDVNVTIASLGSYVFTNTVSGNESDPNPGNNTATLTVNAGGGADVSITVSASTNPALLGSPVTLSGVVTNNGPNVATAVSASLFFPFSTLPTFSTTQGTCTTAPTCSLGDIGPGASVTISATTTFPLNGASPSGIVTVTGTAFSSTTPDPNVGNNFFNYDLQLTNPASSLQRWMVADRATGQIYMFDSATNSPIGQNTNVGVSPDGIAISPNGHIAYVANLNSTYISVVDLSIQREIYRIRFGGANVRNVAFTPDGSRVVAMLNAPKVLIIDAVTFQVLQTIDLSTRFSDSPGCIPLGPAVTGHQAYVACTGSAIIAVVDTNTFAVSTVSGVVGTGQGFAGNSVMAATPDGQFVLSLRSTPSIQIISTASNSVVQTVSNAAITANARIAIGARTSAPLGTYGYFGANVINEVNLTPGPNFGQIVGFTDTLSFTATDLAVSPDGSRLYAISTANSGNNVAVVDTGALLSDSASIVFQGRFGGPCIAINNCPGTLRALAAGRVDTLPIVGAPMISGVTPNFLFNDTATTVTISGSGFASDARVRVGRMDGLPVTFVSSNELRVTIPKGAPAHGSGIIVTNPNASAGLSGQLLSALLRRGTDNGGLEISSPLTFQPKFQAVVSDFGAGSIDFLRQSAGGGSGGSQIPVGTDPMGIAFSPDGSQFYVESFGLQSVVAGLPDCCLFGNPPQHAQIRLSGAPGQVAGIAVAPEPGTGEPAAFVSSQRQTVGTIPGDVQLNVIDVNPYSPAVNSLLYTIPAQMGSPQLPGGLAVTNDGRYVYQNVASNATNPLVIFDTLARSATLIPNTSLGIGTFQASVHITPDNRSLLLGDNSGNVKVFDISANRLSPTLVTTIAPTMPPGLSAVSLDVFRVAGNHLYTYDVAQRVVEVFNFNRTGANFSFINYFKVPGSVPSPVGFAAEIAVTPDESLVYVPVREDDAVAVIDAAKLISGVQGDPTALVTSIATAQGPSAIALSPKRLDTAPQDVAIAISHTPDPVQLGSNVTFNVTLTNFGPFSGSGTHGSGNGGFLINFDHSLVPVPTLSTLAHSPFFNCMLNGTQLLCGFSSNGPDLGPPPQSISGTIVFQTTAAGLAGVTGYIAADNGTFDPNPANNTATDAAAVVSADLGVTMTAAPAAVAPGSNLVYTITVTNNGPTVSTGYTLTDTLPANVTFVSATSGCVLEGVLTCFGSSLGVGQTATYILVVTPTAQGTLTNTASVAGNDVDPNLLNNSFTLQNFAVAADIAVSAAGAPSSVGGFPAYTATITNNGPSNASGVVLTDLLDNYGFVSASSTQGSCTFSAPVLTCNLGQLVNGASAVVTVVVTAPNSGWAANTFHGSAIQPDPNLGNNGVRLGPALDSFNTPVGSNVAINASDPADNLIASLTFSNVTRTGSTTMTSMSAASLPAGFRSGRQPTFFDISTNAEFVGAIALNIHFLPANFRHPALVRLFHFEGGAWVDRTMGLNVASGVIAGQVMSLSPFALLEPVDTIPVANAGADRSVPGAMAAGARVTLDGSASVDADGDSLTYRWSGPFAEGGGTVTGINPTVTLPLGVSKVSLVVNDGEADSPAVALNLAVADFQVSAPAGSVALTRGQSTSFTITMTPQYGAFGAPINLSCAPGAADVTCSFSSASVTPGATASTATLTVTAAATVARVPGRSMPAYFALWLGTTLPVFGVVFLAAGRRKKWQMAVLLMLLLVLVASHIGCGGGGTTQTQSSSSPPPPGTKAVTVTVTGTSGTLQHSSSVTVTIPQ